MLGFDLMFHKDLGKKDAWLLERNQASLIVQNCET
tara:strand:- start:75 stop:179 length:105 start_codon:yes stop_codon:yes gene_type:complete